METHMYVLEDRNIYCIGVFPEWCRTFIEFSEFRELDNSLKQELYSNLKIVSLISVLLAL